MFEKQILALTNYQNKKTNREKEKKGKEGKHKRTFHLGAILSLICKKDTKKESRETVKERQREKGNWKNCCKVFCHILR